MHPQVRHIIQSYGTSLLLESYVPGTRQWLFDRVNSWLSVAIQASGAEAAVRSRMFLLLAGPGMVSGVQLVTDLESNRYRSMRQQM